MKTSKNKMVILMLVSGITVLSVVGTILARYVSQATAETELEIAYYVIGNEVQNKTLKLDAMVPRDEAYEYGILVSNSKDGKTSETAIEYTLEIKTTTNLPLEFSLGLEGEDESQIIDTKTIQDEYGVYYIVMKTDVKEFGLNEEEHKYILSIVFPKEYKANAEYSDIIELVEVKVDSKQKI